MHGFLIIDKPAGMTSRDVVNRIAICFPRKMKSGHAGTLDPLATGVLVIAIGHATRLIEYVQDADKSYLTTIILGANSTTDDADGELEPVANAIAPSREAIEKALQSFLGDCVQTPPRFSAIKIDGKRAYNLARDGAEIEIPSRIVKIHRINLIRFEWPEVELEVFCGKGTYIRSIARDLGSMLNTGGYVKLLRRTSIGKFGIDRATSLDLNPKTAREHIIPTLEALDRFPKIAINPEQEKVLRLGNTIAISYPDTDIVAIVDIANELIGVARVCRDQLQPVKTLPK